MYDGYAYSSSALTNSSLTANITGDQLSFASNGGTDSKELVALSAGKISVPNSGVNSEKFYFVVAPSASKSQTLTFTINGASRSVTRTLALEAGKVTRFTIPINDLQYPHTSDALSITSKGRLSSDQEMNILTLPDPINNNINGQNVPIYIVGSEGTKGSITIKGFAKDMINALPIGFYASRWNDKATAMTIQSVNLWMPEYGNNYSLSKRTEFKDYSISLPIKLQGKYDVDFPISVSVIESVLGVSFQEGITRNVLIGAPFNISPKTITFNGLEPTSTFDNSLDVSNVIILDENPVYKEMSIHKVDTYLRKFSANGKTATYEGVKAILNAAISTNGDFVFSEDETENARLKSLATETAEAIIGKLQSVVGDKVIKKEFTIIFITLTGEVSLKEAISPGFFADTIDFMHKFRDMQFELVIETYPYASAYTTATPSTPYQPIVFWGFDAYGPNDETKPE